MEIGRKIVRGKCKIDTFHAGFYNMIFGLINFTKSSVQRTTFIVFKFVVENEICHCTVLPSNKHVNIETNFRNTQN